MSSGVHSHSTQLIKPKQVLQKKMLISLCSTLYIYIMYIYIYIHITLKVSSLESSSLMSFFPVHLRFSTFSSTPSTHHPGPQPQNKTPNTFSPTSGPLHLHLLRLLSCHFFRCFLNVLDFDLDLLSRLDSWTSRRLKLKSWADFLRRFLLFGEGRQGLVM